jgi:hypothetical protein
MNIRRTTSPFCDGNFELSNILAYRLHQEEKLIGRFRQSSSMKVEETNRKQLLMNT